MTTAIATEQSGIDRFKLETSEVLSQHDYFRKHIYPRMQEGVQYYVVNGKRSLSKAGSEMLCSLYNLTITFERDRDTLESFKSAEGLVAFVATLKRGEQVVGQGRGCSLLKNNGGDYNKTVKMAQKSAAIDGTLRAVGISAFYSQDLEDLPESAIRASTTVADMPPEDLSNADDHYYPHEPAENEEEAEPPISDRQRAYLQDLAIQNLNEEEREEYIANLDSMTKSDASAAIKAMLTLANR